MKAYASIPLLLIGLATPVGAQSVLSADDDPPATSLDRYRRSPDDVIIRERTTITRERIIVRPRGSSADVDATSAEEPVAYESGRDERGPYELRRERVVIPAPPLSIEPAPQPRVVLREAPVTYERVVPGSLLPDWVVVKSFPPRDRYAAYGWVSDRQGRIVLVDPQSRRVVRILER